MEIRDSILKFLYRKNDGRLTDIEEVLVPFDNDRLAIQGTLHNLEKDKIIEVDKDFRLLTWRTAGNYRPLTSFHLLARLTPFGETYYKEHYMSDDKGHTKIEIKNLQNISNSTIGQVNQDSQSTKDRVTNAPIKEANDGIMKNILIGIVVTVIGGLILYYIFGIGN